MSAFDIRSTGGAGARRGRRSIGNVRPTSYVPALALWLLLTAVPVSAQPQFTAPPEAERTLTRREVSSIVESLGDLMASDYVDSLLGARVRRELRAGLEAGRYRKETRARELITRLVQDIQSVIHDDHFNILYFPPQAAGFKWVSSAEGPPDKQAQLEEARQRLRSQNFGVLRAEILEGNIGYLLLSKFDAPLELLRQPLASAFDLLQNTDALIVDIRKNPGGNTECVQLAYSYFADGPPVLSTTEMTRATGEREEYWTTDQPGGARYLGRPVYVLTGPATGSGAEMFAYQMKNRDRGTIVGGRTSGAAHSFDTFKIGTEAIGNVMVLVPNARMVDAVTQADWEGSGVAPDVEAPVDEALAVAKRLALESLMASAKGIEAQSAYQRLIEKMAFLSEHEPLQPEDLEKYVGRYGIRRVYVQDRALKIQRENGPLVDLEHVGEHLFEFNIAMSPKPRVHFQVEGDVATSMVLRGPEGEQRIERDRAASGAGD